MSTRSALSIHPIRYVRMGREGAADERQGIVDCTREGGDVPITTCAHCPRFMRVRGSGDSEELHCLSEPPRALAGEPRRPIVLPRVPVSAIMTRNVICVRDDLTLAAALQLFLESGLKSAPVVDHAGGLIGFIADHEIMLDVHATSNVRDRSRTIGEVVLPCALALPESTSVTRAAAIMALERQQRMAVVSSTGAVIGVLSASDILYWIARADGQTIGNCQGVPRLARLLSDS